MPHAVLAAPVQVFAALNVTAGKRKTVINNKLISLNNAGLQVMVVEAEGLISEVKFLQFMLLLF